MGVSGAWSYGGFSINIDSSGKYQYYGRMKDSIKVWGYYTGKIGRQQWDTLIRKIDSINFKKVDSTAMMGAADVSYYELIIHLQNDKKRIIRAGAFDSDPVSKLLKYLARSYRHLDLKETMVPFPLETTFQNGVSNKDPNAFKFSE